MESRLERLIGDVVLSTEKVDDLTAITFVSGRILIIYDAGLTICNAAGGDESGSMLTVSDGMQGL